MNDYDIVVVGGGLVGLALLDKLEKTKQRVLLIDDGRRSKQPSSRPLVLTEPNVKLLNYNVGLPLKEVKVSIYKKGVLSFKALDYGLPALGYVVDAATLHNSLLTRNTQFIKFGVTVNNISNLEEKVILQLDNSQEITTKILVAADGSDSTIRRVLKVNKIVGGHIDVSIRPNVKISKNTPAHLRFIPGGTLAFLPTGELQGTIVATGSAVNANILDFWCRHLSIVDLPTHQIKYSQTNFYLDRLVYGRVVFLGNSAYSLPPVGAQGFNLGCRGLIKLLPHLAKGDLLDYNSDFVKEVQNSFNVCNYLASGKINRVGAFGLHFVNIFSSIKQELAGMAL